MIEFWANLTMEVQESIFVHHQVVIKQVVIKLPKKEAPLSHYLGVPGSWQNNILFH